jgi:ribosomal protein L9
MLSLFRLEYEQRRNTEDPVKHTKEQISDAKKERAELKQREADVKAEVDAITAELEAIVAESQGEATTGCGSLANAANTAFFGAHFDLPSVKYKSKYSTLGAVSVFKSSLFDSFVRAIGHKVEKASSMKIR